MIFLKAKEVEPEVEPEGGAEEIIDILEESRTKDNRPLWADQRPKGATGTSKMGGRRLTRSAHSPVKYKMCCIFGFARQCEPDMLEKDRRWVTDDQALLCYSVGAKADVTRP